MKKLNLKVLSIIILFIAGSILAYLIYDINKTEKSLAQSLLEKPMQSAKVSLDAFFEPIENSLISAKQQAQLGEFDSITPLVMNRYFGLLIKNFPQLSSMGIANTEGYEYDVIPTGSGFNNRIVWIDKWGFKEKWSSWKVKWDSGMVQNTGYWERPAPHDPRIRPWFKGALNKSGNVIHWTKPYVYNTTSEIGMTASLSWKRLNDSREHILAFDLTLEDITLFTQQLSVSPRGKIFIISKEGNYIGLPSDPMFDQPEQVYQTLLKHVDSVKIEPVSSAYNVWLSSSDNDQLFEYESNDDSWWGRLVKYELSEDNFLIIGVVVPESDILSEVARTKRVIIGGFLFVLVLTGFVLYSYGQSRKANLALAEKNFQILEQKEIIEHAHNEVRASINYAERIQKALLSTEEYWHRISPEHFILFLPRDVVSGDFYWAYAHENKVFWSAADCTGHGVPGAFMSMLGIGFLNEIVGEGKEYEPGQILNKLRFKIIQSLEQKSNDDQRKDGMDIALCALDQSTGKLEYAGAYNPLLLVREKNMPPPEGFDKKVENEEDDYILYEFKANKMPIGKHQLENEGFETQQIQVKKGDAIYVFSDGFQDQFGGPRGKKYMLKKMKKLILSIQDKNMAEQEERLHTSFFDWIKEGNSRQLDDVCVVGIKIT